MATTQHCFTSYTIDEHPDPESVFDWIRLHWAVCDYVLDEHIESLKGFCAHYHLDLRNWAISELGDRGEFIKIVVPDPLDDPGHELRGMRLWKYLQNNYATYRCQFTGKQAATLAGDCPFTGVYCDEILLDPIRAFIAAPDDRTWQELVDDCAAALLKALHAECEYRYSDEALRDDCEASEYEFYESGEIA